MGVLHERVHTDDDLQWECIVTTTRKKMAKKNMQCDGRVDV